MPRLRAVSRGLAPRGALVDPGPRSRSADRPRTLAALAHGVDRSRRAGDGALRQYLKWLRLRSEVIVVREPVDQP